MEVQAHPPPAPPAPGPPPGRSWPRWAAPAALGAAVAVPTAAIAAIGPTDDGIPLCPTQGLLGVDCPLCGGLRCVGALARGDLLAAADHNVVLAVVLPVLAVVWAWWLVRAVADRPLRLPAPPAATWWAGGAVVVAFGVARNLGGDGWLGWLASTAT